MGDLDRQRAEERDGIAERQPSGEGAPDMHLFVDWFHPTPG
jgi:hypothetical protein